MFCSNCGKEIPEGAEFCEFCGAEIAPDSADLSSAEATPVAETPSAEFSPANDTPADPVAQTPTQSEYYQSSQGDAQPPRKKSKKGLIIFLCVLLAVILAGVASVLFCPPVKTWFNKTFRSGEKNVSMAIENRTTEWTDDYVKKAEAPGSADVRFLKGESAMKSSATVTLSESGKALISKLTGFDLSWANNVSFDLTTEIHDTVLNCGGALMLNGVKVTDVETVLDLGAEKMLVKCDLLGEDYYDVPVNLSGIGSVVGAVDSSSIGSLADSLMISDSLTQFLSILPEPEKVAEIVNRYVKVALSVIQDVESETVNVEAGGIAKDVTKYHFYIDEEFVSRLGQSLVKEARDDADIYGIVKRGCEVFGEAVPSEQEWKEMCDDALEQSGPEYLDFEKFKVSLYVDAMGDICGIDVRQGDEKLSVISLKKGDDFAVEVVAGFANNMTASVVVEGTEKDGKSTGTVRVRVGDLANLTVLRFYDIVYDLDKNLTSGKITFSLDDYEETLAGLIFGYQTPEELQHLVLSIAWDASNEKASCTVALDQSGAELISVGVSFSSADLRFNGSETPPSKSPSEIDEEDAANGLMDRLIEAGVPEALFIFG